MLQFQYQSRGKEARDMNLLLDNNSYVQTWSMAQLLIIIVTTVIQVYCVKKLFQLKTTGYSRARI